MREATAGVAERWTALQPQLNERTRRLAAAAESRAIGRDGVVLVHEVTGPSQATILRGRRDLDAAAAGTLPGVVRRPGAGWRRLVDTDPTRGPDLDQLVPPVTRGDPESALLWTAKSGRFGPGSTGAGPSLELHRSGGAPEGTGVSLASQSEAPRGHPASRTGRPLPAYRRPDPGLATGRGPRDLGGGQDNKLVGDFKARGPEWHPTGQPEDVQCHDFVSRGIGKACPDGMYDVTHQAGWVGVGQDHDTAPFAVHTIERWWTEPGHARYPSAHAL